jgi:hypothetical protein
MLLGALLWLWWRIADDFYPLRLHFTLLGAAFLAGMAMWEAYLALTAMSRFEIDEPLHRTWFLIGMSAVCRLTGWTLQHVIAPLLNEPHEGRWVWIGTTVAAPLAMAFLAAGLMRVVRVYRRCGYTRRLLLIDYFAIVIVLGYVLSTAATVARLILSGEKPLYALPAINWVTDPLLSILLILAIVLRRSVYRMGGGLIARCWTAYIAAILLTTAGDVSQWAVSYGYIAWPWTSLTWFIWYPAAASYTLGAAYQMEAIDRAEE